jgi:phage shock protein C
VAARQLTRSETDRRIAGVCGGLAEYFDVDPVLVRVAFVVAAFMGFGILLYIVLWIVAPRSSHTGPSRTGYSNAVRIAEERYAHGEISAEELARIRSDLAGGPP